MKRVDDAETLREMLSADRAVLVLHARWSVPSLTALKRAEAWERDWVGAKLGEGVRVYCAVADSEYPAGVVEWLEAEGLGFLQARGAGEVLWLEAGRVVAKCLVPRSTEELVRQTERLWALAGDGGGVWTPVARAATHEDPAVEVGSVFAGGDDPPAGVLVDFGVRTVSGCGGFVLYLLVSFALAVGGVYVVCRAAAWITGTEAHVRSAWVLALVAWPVVAASGAPIVAGVYRRWEKRVDGERRGFPVEVRESEGGDRA